MDKLIPAHILGTKWHFAWSSKTHQRMGGRALSCSYSRKLIEDMSFEETIHASPLLATKDIMNSTRKQPDYIMMVVFPVCPPQKASEELLFKSTEETIKTFLRKAYALIHVRVLMIALLNMLGRNSLSSWRIAKHWFQLSPPLSSSVRLKKHQSRKLYFFLLKYSAIFAPRGKETDIELKGLRIKQMKEAYQ